MFKLETRNANLWYGEKQALKGISIGIDPNTVTAFIGPSGCGKSTLLRCFNRMNDLIENTKIEGDYLLDNDNIYKETDVYELRKRVGMVFQKPNPFPTMSIFDNVAAVLKLNGVKDKKIIKSSEHDYFVSVVRISFTRLLHKNFSSPAYSMMIR